MNAVVQQTEPMAPAANEGATLISMIERVALNPDVDIDKMERLLAMKERIEARDAEAAFNDAMNAAQAEMAPIATDATNPQTKSRYASYPALDRALRPIYTRHGFSLSFYSAEGAPADHVRVACKVSRGGHSERPYVDMPADGKGAKGGDVMTKTHAAGSAFSYGQRYLLKLIFNIAVGDDDDGNRAGSGPLVTPDQVDDLIALMDEVGADRQRFLNFLRIDTLAHLPAKRFDEAWKALQAKRRA